jgi:hypothetical protein
MLIGDLLCRVVGVAEARSRGPSDALWLNYEQMLACRADTAKECPRVATLLQASTFMRMHRNDRGEVSAHTLIDIIVRQVTLWQIRLDLCSYDFIGNGELTEIELQTYVPCRAAPSCSHRGVVLPLDPD